MNEDSVRQNTGSKVFSLVSSEKSGLDFKNVLKESDNLNYFTYEYLYNGGGVCVGDINNDELPDLFFTGNMSPNRLYLNRGNLTFEDVTSVINLNKGNDWCTGANMIDINQDGNLDIYICRSGWFEDSEKRENLLFINNGDGSFSERAKDFGLNDTGYSTQAAFFDFDQDGDLDMYLANHPAEFSEDLKSFKQKHLNPPNDNRDKLYRNDNNSFTEIGLKAGIKNYGHTLGLVTADFNNDGWLDIYTSNDYQEPDYLYLNNKDGSFTNIAPMAMKHHAKFSMGVDANDINNDGWIDLFTVEMMAEDNKRQKTNMAPMNPDIFWRFVDEGFSYQYMHNCLQLNNTNNTFSEIAYLSGVATTDWSWSPLIADFNNDGFKDIFVSNGYKRDVLDKDFKEKMKTVIGGGEKKFSEIEAYLPSTPLPNYIFENNKDLTFTNQSNAWGINQPSFSNGAAYADLDLDGDLEIIVNNLDSEVSLYQNNINQKQNFLRVQLVGPASNIQAIGSKALLYIGDQKQVNEVSSSRGFQSSSETTLHFGLHKQETIDELHIHWFDGQVTKFSDVKTNQTVKIVYDTSEKDKFIQNSSNTSSPLFKDYTAEINLNFSHKELEYDDYQSEVLLPHKLSQEGPSISVADVNGDGLEDFYIGGAAGFEGGLYIQTMGGTFQQKQSPAFTEDKDKEDVGSIFFDADQDGDMDLYVVSGSNEFEEGSSKYIDRLYINDGQGLFSKDVEALPNLAISGSCVIHGDFDQDGDEDLFVGGYLRPQKYPFAPQSYLLQNNKGKFQDVTQQFAPELAEAGMVKDAVWTDYDKDGDSDLIVVGEWMPIQIYENENNLFKNKTSDFQLDKSSGWWNCITPGDFDMDGDMDYALGNLGLNSKNQASISEPFLIYAKDFDDNGKNDVVLAYHQKGNCFPVRGLQCSSEQIPTIKKKMVSYENFGSASLDAIYGSEALESALNKTAFEFQSAILWNEAKGFKLSALPIEAQFAPTQAILAEDYDKDGCLDLLLVGNQYPVEVETGRYDAHKGLLLKGNCGNDFSAVPFSKSGFFVDGDARSLASLNLNGKTLIISGLNNDKPTFHLIPQ